MPTFDTPEPISVKVEFGAGEITIAASNRADTVVEVRPSNPDKKGDVAAAQHTRVEYANGRLHITAPKGRRYFSFLSGGESIAIQIDLPTASQVRGESGAAVVRGTGRLDECHFSLGAGEIHLAETGAVRVKMGAGDIAIERVVGDVEVSTGSGAVRIDSIDGAAVVKNANGETSISEITGDLRVNAANGKIVVERAQAGVTAKTANGDVRLVDVMRGPVDAQTARGKVDIGIHEGVAAWLDLDTSFGKVRSELDATERPAAGEDAVEVRARTSFGDVTIRRAPTSRTAR